MELLTKEQPKVDLDDLGVSTMFRCDRCGAQAYGCAVKGELALFFCGHHLNAFEKSLVSDGWEIDRRTHLINKKPYEGKEEE